MPALKQVVLLDKIDPSASEILSKNGLQAMVFVKFTDIPAEVLKTLDGLVIRSATTVNAEIMDKCPNLSIIGRAGTGVDNVDVPAATARGIVVMNTPGGNTISAAEHTCYMVVSLARLATNNNVLMKSHKWNKQMGNELLGKTLAIIGLGRIGSEVASRMQSFGMRTIGYDPMVSKEQAAKSGIEWMTLEEIWPLCDYITVHTPLIAQTKGLVCEATFAKCKKGVKVINVARGGIISETDLLAALQSGQCGGAGLDVFVEEPVKDWTLVDHPNVIATSHLGASTKEGQLKCGQEIAQQFVDFSNNAAGLTGVINSPALVSSLSSDNSPWLRLGQALAQISASLSTDVNGKWQLKTIGTGQPAALKSFAVAAVSVGVLKSQPNSSVNVINAPSLAEKAGISVELNLTAGESANARAGLSVVSPSGVTVSGFVDGSLPYLSSVDSNLFSAPTPLSGSLFLGRKSGELSGLLSGLASAGLQSLNVSSGDVVVGVASSPVSLPGFSNLTL
jgi:D-3-phosphoglycerate dehydrogenase